MDPKFHPLFFDVWQQARNHGHTIPSQRLDWRIEWSFILLAGGDTEPRICRGARRNFIYFSLFSVFSRSYSQCELDIALQEGGAAVLARCIPALNNLDAQCDGLGITEMGIAAPASM